MKEKIYIYANYFVSVADTSLLEKINTECFVPAWDLGTAPSSYLVEHYEHGINEGGDRVLKRNGYAVLASSELLFYLNAIKRMTSIDTFPIILV